MCSSKKHNYFKKKEKNLPNLFISSLCRRSFTRIDKGTFFFSNWESDSLKCIFKLLFKSQNGLLVCHGVGFDSLFGSVFMAWLRGLSTSSVF